MYTVDIKPCGLQVDLRICR